MAEESQRRRKLIQLIKDLALIETTKNNKVPTALSDYILGKYGLKRSPNVNDLPDEESTEFILKLENLIKERYRTRKSKEHANTNEGNVKCCFMKACDAFTTAKNEYLRISTDMNSLLHEVLQFKEKYSEHLKEKSSEKKGEVEVLEKKLKCLKLQFFLKLYGEGNALDAHLRLRGILAERLKALQLQYNNLLDLVGKYNELKNNKSYIELLQLYKQLVKKEMKIDYMAEK